MLSFTKPDHGQINAFLAAQNEQAFSYPEVGESRQGSPAGYDLDHNRVALGTGEAIFDAACLALRQWRMFPRSWMDIRQLNSPLGDGVPTPPHTGNVVAMLARVFGLWWTNACRVIYVIDEREPIRRFGFAYGTLPGHVEQGEERFSIEWDKDDVVWYDVRAFSRPRHWLARLGYPLVRRLQRRFIAESQQTMKDFVISHSNSVQMEARP